MTLQQCRKALIDRNIAAVARRIGMTRQQLWLIAVGINANPTQNTVKRISDYLESGERE
jgi:DNA-binding phage protein